MTRPGARTQTRWPVFSLVAVFAFVLAIIGGTASAADAAAAENRVRAQTENLILAVGAEQPDSLTKRLGKDAPQQGIVSATGVAAKTAPGKIGLNPKPNATVGDLAKLEPGELSLSTGKSRPLSELSDRELLDSVFNPKSGEVGDLMETYVGSNTLANGNHRAAELLTRAKDFRSQINLDTPIFIRNYVPPGG